jgi:DNA-directed RNA polymerase specialized sigma24 family protein/CheY-like chemotaxis protein
MSLGQQLQPHLPFLRRYARALTGNQTDGDAYVRATLEAIIAAPNEFPSQLGPRVGLYRTFHAIWESSGGPSEDSDREDQNPQRAIATARLAVIPPQSRQALLLTAMEGFSNSEVAYLIDTNEEEVDALVDEAMAEIESQTRTQVLIIEDEPIIAMDIETIVRDLGHDVTSIAITRDEAVRDAMSNRPGLVLADIQLADDSSGIDAVSDILAEFPVPVIFITAFPERLLTGQRPEPTFLITKPFQRATVKAAISQALFFNSETTPA